MPAVIFSGAQVKALKDQLDLNGTASILTGTDDPTSVAKDAPIGSLYLRQGGGGEIYKKDDAGSSTNWTLLATGGGAEAEAIVSKTASATLASNEVDGSSLINNDGAAADIELTLPAASGSEKVIIMVSEDGFDITVTAASGDDIKLADTDLSSGSIKSDANRSVVQLHAIDSTTWQAAYDEGMWINNDLAAYSPGGLNTAGTKQNIHEKYTPGTDTWSGASTSGAFDYGHSFGMFSYPAVKEYRQFNGNLNSGNNSTKNLLYNAVTDAWSTETVVPLGQNEMSSQVVGTLGYSIGNGLGSSTLRQYDKDSGVGGTWSTISPSGDAIIGISNADGNGTTDGTDMFTMGGASGGAITDIQKLDISGASWATTTGSLSGALSTAVVQNRTLQGTGNNVYSFGGAVGPVSQTIVFKYDTVGDSGANLGTGLTTALEQAGGASINANGYIFSGDASGTVNAASEVLDYSADTFSNITNKTTGTKQHHGEAA